MVQGCAVVHSFIRMVAFMSKCHEITVFTKNGAAKFEVAVSKNRQKSFKVSEGSHHNSWVYFLLLLPHTGSMSSFYCHLTHSYYIYLYLCLQTCFTHIIYTEVDHLLTVACQTSPQSTQMHVECIYAWTFMWPNALRLPGVSQPMKRILQ